MLRMWKKKVAGTPQQAEPTVGHADLEILRASVKAEVLAEVNNLLSREKIISGGQPNFSPLNIATCNLDYVNLNLKFFGYRLARELSRDLPRLHTQANRVGLQSKASTQADMEGQWVAHWCAELRIRPVLHRKLWELAYVLQALFENDMLKPGLRGLGFGCGEEPIPSYLASKGVAATVTDLAADQAQAAGWVATGQHAASLAKAYQPEMLARDEFDRLVDLQFVDMNAIPESLRGYDFCWSVCALEHLGSIEQGLDFIENSLDTIKPGGVAVHTTELNIDPHGPTIDHWPTVLFQRRHFEQLADRLRGQGHHVAELNFDLGDRPMDQFIDLPPWSHDLPAELAQWLGRPLHLKVAIDGFASTCFGILVRKRPEAPQV